MSEYYSYSLSGKIRKYITGIMLLALAGFIISAVENIVASIPDQTITLGGNAESNIIVIRDRESTTLAGSVIAFTPDTSQATANLYLSTYVVFLRDPPIGYKYIIVFRYTSTISYVNIVNFDYNQYWRYELQVVNDYVHIEWADSISWIEIYTNNQTYTENVYIFVVRADTDIPFQLDFSRAVQAPRFSDLRENFKNNTVIVLTPDTMWNPYDDYLTHTYYVIPRLTNPPLGYKYVIVFKYVDYIEKVYIRDCSEYHMYYYWDLWDFDYIYNDYVFIEWNSCITDFFIYAYSFPYAYNVYIFVVSENTSVPFSFSESEIINAITQKTQDIACADLSVVSSKMFLRLISWIASVFIVITALHKFDIYI
jgi:hypothetical protein